MNTRVLIAAVALACLHGCGGPRDSAPSRAAEEGVRIGQSQAKGEAEYATATDLYNPEGVDGNLAHSPIEAVEGPAPAQEGQEGVASAQPESQPEDRDGDPQQVELVISGVTDAPEVHEPAEPDRTGPEGSRRGFCTVAVRAGKALGEQHALLYSYFTPDTPEELKKLAPGLLESSFQSTKLGTFSGGRGAVSGMKKLSDTVTDEVVLCLPRGSKVTGDIGVRAQLWRFSGGRWKPHDDVLEQTITLK